VSQTSQTSQFLQYTFPTRPNAKVFLASSTIFTAVALVYAAPAAAQDAAGEDGAQSGQLPSIIVTANRREENLQDVALSAEILGQGRISAIFADAADTVALAGSVPGLNV
jgi:outer membrane cobalamin receptor